MTKYLVCVTDYSKALDAGRVKDFYNTRVNALLHVMDIIYDVQHGLQGAKEFKSFASMPSKSGFKEGVFVIQDRSNPDRYSVYNRVRSIGYVYNGFTDVLIKDVYVVTIDFGCFDEDDDSEDEDYVRVVGPDHHVQMKEVGEELAKLVAQESHDKKCFTRFKQVVEF